MLDHKIEIRFWIILFISFIIVIHCSCIQNISESENENIEILKTSIELDRLKNELFLQIETNQNYSQELIKSVSTELTYIGDNIHQYSETFELYDNGTNGDLIASNGIYTLLTTADVVVLPEINPEIKKIEMAQNFILHKTNSDSLDISIAILGKSFQLFSLVIDISNNETFLSKNVNIDNSYIELLINKEYIINLLLIK